MLLSERTPIGDIVAKLPRASFVFERHRIDYWCGGDQALGEACRRSQVDPREMLSHLARVNLESSLERDWTGAPLAELIAHLMAVHHAYLRVALPAISAAIDDAARRGRPPGWIAPIRELFTPLRSRIERHLPKEEQVLFPAIERRGGAVSSGRSPTRHAFAGVRDGLAGLERDHRAVNEALRSMRLATGDYRLPTDAPEEHAMLVTDLLRLEADVHHHLHLENNVLFPRAVALEAAYD